MKKNNTVHKLLVSFCSLMLVAFMATAQSGKLTGVIISAKTGEPLTGASIKLEKTDRGTKSDVSGAYSFGGLAAGTYTVTVSYVGYETKSVSDDVKANEVTYLNISLDQASKTGLGDVVVRGNRTGKQESVASLLIAQKNSAVVSDGIPAELIRKTPDRNTSDVLKRVSGVSIQDNKFAVVRGLNDRYNAAFLNGAPLPSSENDRKAFAFDIFPANMLDNIVILKTASPDLPGEFAGGIININTSSIPSKNFTSISIGTGANTITTFKDGMTYKGGGSDWLGLDNGARAIPAGLPATSAFPTQAAQRAALAKLYTNNSWGIDTRNVAPNLSFQISQGFNIQRKGTEFIGILLSASYNKSYTFYGGELNSYEYNRDNPSEPPVLRSSFSNNNHSESTLAGLIANFSVKINNNNRINLKNIVSINSEDRVFDRNGRNDLVGDPEFLIKSNALWFTSNVINSSQLFGDHNLSAAKIKVNWLMSYSKVKRDIPDLRQMNYGLSSGADVYSAIVPSTTVSAGNSGSRFYSTTDENIYSAKLDIAKTLGQGSSFETVVKLGGYYQNRDRGFDARLLGFGSYFRPGQGFDYDLLNLTQDKIFDSQNLGILSSGKGGFLLLDGTNPTFAYTAESNLAAAYIMGDSRINKDIRVVYGVRYEHFNQKLDSYTDFTNKINLNTEKGDVLPSINVVYSLNTKQNVRLAYSKTLNRPEFRELAPFAFYDFSNNIVIGGNPDLTRALIDNFDVRYEVYPGRGQLFSFSGFYKYFKNPIELSSDPNNFNSSQYQNSIEANNYGFELEFRSLLSTLLHNEKSKFLDNLTFSANAAYIFSKVKEAPFAGVVKTVEDRYLQGQSPYLVNSSLSYVDNLHGWSWTISGNRVGQRIFIVGSLNEPDTWEQGRTIVDFQFTKTLMKQKLELKLNCRDLLRQKQLFFLDENENQKYDKNSDKLFQSRTFGSVISATATYKF